MISSNLYDLLQLAALLGVPQIVSMRLLSVAFACSLPGFGGKARKDPPSISLTL